MCTTCYNRKNSYISPTVHLFLMILRIKISCPQTELICWCLPRRCDDLYKVRIVLLYLFRQMLSFEGKISTVCLSIVLILCLTLFQVCSTSYRRKTFKNSKWCNSVTSEWHPILQAYQSLSILDSLGLRIFWSYSSNKFKLSHEVLKELYYYYYYY
jgi:hypothetical protein